MYYYNYYYYYDYDALLVKMFLVQMFGGEKRLLTFSD